jgi:hypothetical protein
MKLKLLLLLVATCAGVFLLFAQETPGSKIQNSFPSVTKVPVVFSGGHETDPRDHGRPVVLIAAALGVSSDVFREAFSHVHPADPNVGPTGDEARRNKAALLGALSKYGVTNERLDAVSDYYRYVKSRGELWHTKPAVVNALVKEGHVIGYEILNGGSGYSSPPSVSVPGIEGVVATAKLSFSQN